MRPSSLLAGLSVLMIANAATAATYRVGSGAGCTHATIQAAIDAAAADPEVADFIRIARNTTHANVALDINNQHLILEGGYANCTATSTAGARTTLNGNGANSVIRIRGNGDVVLNGFVLSGGAQPRTPNGLGGGLQITGGPHLVSLTNLVVSGNEAGRGGGISVRNTINGNPNDVVLVLDDDVVILNNRAGYPAQLGGSRINGGGIYCNEAMLRMIGGGSTTISTNEATDDGGGIGAEECTMTIAPHGAGDFNGIVNNYAGRDGGGLAIAGFSGDGTRFYVTDPQRPVQISGNAAAREGGAIKLNSGAVVDAWDLIVDGNRAYDEGGAISIFSDVHNNGTAEFNLRGNLDGAPAGAVNCAPAKRCNRISGNEARDAAGQLRQAAALRLYGGGGALDVGYTHMNLFGTRIVGNAGLNLARLRTAGFPDDGSADLKLSGVVMAGNALANELILGTDEATVTLCSSSIGANTIGGADVIRMADFLTVFSSIIWQPGRRAINHPDLDPEWVRYLIASDLTGVPASTTNLVANPLFVDATTADLHLSAQSPAIDYAPAMTTPPPIYCPLPAEADRLQRVVDLAQVPNEFGPMDAGAYERQSFADDLIFADGFDGD